jgi:hypothetical protein
MRYKELLYISARQYLFYGAGCKIMIVLLFFYPKNFINRIFLIDLMLTLTDNDKLGAVKISNKLIINLY